MKGFDDKEIVSIPGSLRAIDAYNHATRRSDGKGFSRLSVCLLLLIVWNPIFPIDNNHVSVSGQRFAYFVRFMTRNEQPCVSHISAPLSQDGISRTSQHAEYGPVSILQPWRIASLARPVGGLDAHSLSDQAALERQWVSGEATRTTDFESSRRAGVAG